MFTDRSHAGRSLASHLRTYAGRPDVVVLALPRGGVPVAVEVAVALAAPLDLFLVAKVGAPRRPELAIAAVGSGGALTVNESVVRRLGLAPRELDALVAARRVELERRERAYGRRPGGPALADKVVLLVDDGLATGASMRVAVCAVQAGRPSKVVVAVPVGPPDTCRALAAIVDEVVCPLRPLTFSCVGEFYADFRQVSDDQVRDLLRGRP